MEKLNNEQKEFILENFFKNGLYIGWREIAEKLLDNGECIVAGLGQMWNGGIGNFITVDPYQHGVGCSIYKFNLDDFLDSDWFVDVVNKHIESLNQERVILEKRISSLYQINNVK